MVNILVLCTGNSCRSVLGEALFNKLGARRVKAYSAGSKPIGRINVNAVKKLQEYGIDTEGFTSQSWSEFEDQKIDIAITVCDNANNEECPVYLNSVVRAHWGLSDPAHLKGTDEEISAAFEVTYDAVRRRVTKMLELPFETMDAPALTMALNEIGKIDD
ncbi:MAG: arsenate reductase ArsC [Methylococcales bacterium]|nr:arsenate reductase ArsC [Methylococcales bacterium]